MKFSSVTRQQLTLYATPSHTCSYLPDYEATTVFTDPMYPKDGRLYNALLQQGFRRSGEYLYRPQCSHCQQCIPVRMPVQAFQSRRSQRRTLKKNADLRVRAVSSVYREEQFLLYEHYLHHRHRDGGMDDTSPGDYKQFLTSTWTDTRFYEFRLDKQLVMVAVVDYLDNAWSAVYTFFDPTLRERGLGVYAVLWEIHEAARLGLDYLYLGYWIQDCQKMSYKNEYQPLEYYIDGIWRVLRQGAT